MEKTITITEEEYRKLVAETTAEIMEEHGKENPSASVVFSLTSITFAAALARKMFPEEEHENE